MAGLLDSDYISELFGSVFAPIYGDGSLIRVDMVRQSGGSLVPVEQAPEAVKVQVDAATEAMRQAQGYTATDVALYVLQSGVTGRTPKSDDRLVAQGRTWLIADVTQDPARSYWLMRGVEKAS